MDELIAFLRRCLDDDERAIERMRSTPMHGVESGAEEDYLMFANRAPAEVKVKRAILDRYEDACEQVRNPVDGLAYGEARRAQFELKQVIAAFAQLFAGHEGWQEEWRSLTP